MLFLLACLKTWEALIDDYDVNGAKPSLWPSTGNLCMRCGISKLSQGMWTELESHWNWNGSNLFRPFCFVFCEIWLVLSAAFWVALQLQLTRQSCAATNIGGVVDIEDISLSSTSASSFDSLPKHWFIPLDRVKLACRDNEPVVLGKGGFGIVYQAIVRQENAALKIVKGGTAKEQARLLHEIKVLEQCRSMHIVKFLGYSVADTTLILCMELLSGGSLYDALRQGDEFQWYNRWSLMISFHLLQ